MQIKNARRRCGKPLAVCLYTPAKWPTTGDRLRSAKIDLYAFIAKCREALWTAGAVSRGELAHSLAGKDCAGRRQRNRQIHADEGPRRPRIVGLRHTAADAGYEHRLSASGGPAPDRPQRLRGVSHRIQ